MSCELTTQDIERSDSLSRAFCSIRNLPSHDYDDHVAVGRLGLVKAAHDYQPNPRATFKTYAYYRILGELKDYIRSNFVRHSKTPKAHTQAISLEQLRQDIGWEPSADGLEGRTINKDLCSKLLATLPQREKMIFKAYYFDEFTMRDIGKVLGYAESRVSQIITKTLKLLRKRTLSIS